MKRGLASPWVHSALAITRRLRLQLSRVDQRKSLKRRAPRRGIDVGAPQLGGKEVAAAEHVERQVAVAVVVAVEEAAFLVTVDGVVGRIEIEDDLLGRVGVRLQEQLDEEPLDRRLVMRDLVIARRLR